MKSYSRNTMNKYAHIANVYNFLPEKVYTNHDFFNDFPAEKDKPGYEKLGIKSRHVMDEAVTVVDYMIRTAGQWLQQNGMSAGDIDFLVVNSNEQDYPLCTHNAVLVHEGIGMRSNAGAIDLSYGCSAYVYGLSVAAALAERQQMNHVLFITASNLTRRIYKKDKSNRFLFGDAVSVTHITLRNSRGIGKFVFGADGRLADKIRIRDGGLKSPLNANSFEETSDQYGNITTAASFYMDGAAVFLFTLQVLPDLIRDTLLANECTRDEIDYYIFHQTNRYMNDVLCKRCEIPKQKFLEYMETTGNTVASSIPLVIEHYSKQGILKPGHRVMLAGFGSGFSWCSTVVTV